MGSGESPDEAHHALATRWDEFASWLTSGRWWAWRTGLLALVVTFVMHPPPFVGPLDSGNWAEVERQAHDPLQTLDAAPESHAAKLAFRLVPPLLVRAGLGPAMWLVLQACIGLAVLAAVATLVGRAWGSRDAGLLSALAVAATMLGGVFTFDSAAFFDGLAIGALVLAMASRWPAVQVLLLLVGMFTDERALIATLGVAAFGWIVARRQLVVAAVVAAVAYAALRTILAARYGLSTPSDATGLAIVRDHLPTSAPALWLAPKALWLYAAAGFAVLVRRRRVVPAVLLAGSVALPAMGALAVLDVTRSALYLLPAVLAGAAAAANEDRFRHLPAVALAGCLLLPTVSSTSPTWTWIYPLPIRLLSI